ncbi:universal stress protein [Christiangramia salexigens]|uniref:Universal stress protein UspA n=1 Tax=Christiangramia salexigens TaxID=1913577 RepID=A0A1L3J7B3_9FLAO|nr:universal stress protein [Christiangramia salexigens]APG61032.1 universal stress protein UspA [Christiangramia salexigens]
MKKILVPVDFSKHSEYALEVAANIAKKHNATINVLHMMGLAESFLTKDQTNEVFNGMYFMKLAKLKFSEFLNKDYLEGVTITQTIRNYKVFREVNDVAKEFGAELIVMGSHGTTGFQDVFIGSNTQKVIRTSETPVLIVKDRMKDFKLKKGVFLTDFDLNSIGAFKEAQIIFEQLGAKLKLLFINLPEKFMSTVEIHKKAEIFREEANLDKGSFDKMLELYNDYSLERGAFNYCKELKADIIGVATHGRKGLGHFFYGSTGEDVANHSSIPVLTFKI